jgi:Bacterial archaeo-eukaryotic release factor family 3
MYIKEKNMNNILPKEEIELIGAHYMPAVSMLLPFDPKMCLRAEIEHQLKIALGKVSKQLRAEFPAEKAIPVIEKLHRLIQNLNYNTHKKSIAIFASPIVEKVFYLDISIEEKIVIDESFEIRDLVLNKINTIQYLILLLNTEHSRMFLASGSSFILIKSNIPDNAQDYKRDLPGKTTHFSDIREEKEILLDNFMHHMDQGLSLILKAYPLPVFVMGPKRVTGHFKALTKNHKNIVQYIHGNFAKANETVFREVMKPYLADWRKIQEQLILREIDKAQDENKLVTGLKEVWSVATHRNGKLLIIERDYTCSASLAGDRDKIQIEDENTNKAFYIKDAVDDIIEKILENGGDVEFVDNDVLKATGHIALIKFY